MRAKIEPDAADPGANARNPAGDLPAFVRVDTRVHLDIKAQSGESRIAARREEGAYRLRFPKVHGGPPEAVLVNVAGGLAGGDRAAISLRVGSGAQLSFTSAAAERIYRSAGATTAITASLTLEKGARACWLPQETILQESARLDRRIEIDFADDARLVFGEMLYFGRRASGEAYSQGELRESWRVRRAGRLILADEARLDGDFAARLARPGSLGRHVALATLIVAMPEAGEHLGAIRAVLAGEKGLESGASDLGGLVLARMACHDAAGLRAGFLGLVRALAPRLGVPVPRSLST